MAAPRCFVIGPMSGDQMATLNWLAYQVIKPLLPDGFVVQTPDLQQIGNIMNQVIRCCDRATVVVANVSGNNPNVLYEVAALDAMGRACIPVQVIEHEASKRPATPGDETGEDQRVAFDRAAYRCFPIHRDPSRRAETDKMLRAAIGDALDKHSAGGLFENPLTDFYRVPLSCFSSAYGLARGYFLNLVEPAVAGIVAAFGRREEPGAASKAFPDSACDVSRYAGGKVQIVMPRTLDQAYRFTVDKIVRAGLIKPVGIPAQGRVVTLYEWATQDDSRTFKWVDIPTTIASLREIVRARLGPNPETAPESEFRELEAEEIDRFRKALRGRISGSGLELRTMVEIVDWPDSLQ